MGSSIRTGRSVDARQFVGGAERRAGRRSAHARRPLARATLGQSVRNVLLPLPGPVGRSGSSRSAAATTAANATRRERRPVRVPRESILIRII